MSNIVTARDPDIIAAEINTIKRRVQQTVIFASIEIGQKLTEAKSLVNHGEWSKWLEDNVEYSQSTANYLMQLYQEYGTGQVNLFDTWTNSQTFAKLSYSQHIALLALPFGERQQFAEENNVEDMSTRQLQQAIKERDEAIRLQKEAEARTEAANARARDAEQSALNMQQQIAAAKSSEGAWQEQFSKLEGDKKRAEQSESKALKLLDNAKKLLKETQEKEASARKDLDALRQNPEVPEALMEQMRREAEVAAAEKATQEAEKRIKAAEDALEAATRDREQAEAAAQELQGKLDAAEKKLKMASPDIAEYNTLAQKLMSDYKVLDDLRKKITVPDKETGAKLKQFQTQMVSMWADALNK